MPYTPAVQPVRATKLNGSVGLRHRLYDDAIWGILNAVQTFLSTAAPGFASLQTYLAAIVEKTNTVRAKVGTAADVGVGFANGDNDTGLYSGGDGVVKIAANAVNTVTFSPTETAFATKISVSNGTLTPGSAEVFLPGIDDTVSGGLFVKWDGTAGALSRATSQRALKENFRSVDTARALDVVRQLKPTIFDAKNRGADRAGITTGITGFIAEDLAEINEPGLAAVDENDTPIGRNDEAILTFVVAAVQHLADKFDRLEGGR